MNSYEQIFRGNSSVTPFCNIQIPIGGGLNEIDFTGKVIFHPETEMTTEEHLLCTAAAIAFVYVIIFCLYKISVIFIVFPESCNESEKRKSWSNS